MADPLHAILSSMRIESAIYARLEATAPWGIRICQPHPARFGLVADGACWLCVRDGEAQTALGCGDCFVLPRGGRFELRDEPTRCVTACREVIGDRWGETVVINGGGVRCVVVIGALSFDETASRPLLDILPDVLHLPSGDDENAALRATLALLATETARPRVGSVLVTARLGEILFVQALRAFVESSKGQRVGWLAALSDRRLGAALRALHADIAHDWTVASLATLAGMSRSSFAQRFKEMVGEAPLEHLARWRAHRATCYLRHSSLPIAEIAAMTGYDSDGAFSRAFRRHIGMPPGEYRRTATNSPDAVARLPLDKRSGPEALFEAAGE